MKLFLGFLRSALIMGLMGMALGFCYARFFQKDLLGGIKAGVIVGTLGCMVGGFMFNVVFDMPFLQWLNTLPYVRFLLVNPFDINFVAALLGTWMFLAVYRQISSQN